MATNDTSYGEYRQEQATRRVDNEYETTVESAVDDLQRSLATGDDETFAVAASTLVELLNIDADYVYENGDLHCASELPWHPDTLLAFLTDPERVESESRPWKQSLAETLTAIAVANGTVDPTIQIAQPAHEYSTQVGRRYVRPTSSASGGLEMIDPDDDLKATLLTGGQGAGKSTALGTLVEDRIERGHAVADLVDFHKGENGMYDVEADPESTLQQIRKDYGLSTGFSGDYDPPEVSILAPLTHHLEDSRIPVKEETGEPVVNAFTIPASDLTFRQLVMLMPHSTKTQQKHVKAAHQYLEQTDRDWTLKDFAETIRQKTNAGEKIAASIARSLKTVQQKSFVRDEDSGYKLDWQNLMQRERHVAAFTVHMIRDRSDKLAILSYLIDSLYDARQKLIRRRKLDEYPPLTAVMRELHTIAPRKKSEQDAEKTTEGYMIDTLADLLALMRHVNMDVLADTQKFYRQLSPSISGLFHRVFCFNGHRRDIREVFNTRVDDTTPVEDIAQYPDGQCALVDQGGATYPIAMSPPRHHHLDAKEDGDGLSFRASVLDDEVLVESPYSADVPPRLRFGGRFDPRVEFWDRYVTKTSQPKDYVVKKTLTEQYNEWASSLDYQTYDHRSFCQWVKNNRDIDDAEPVIDGKQQYSWRGITLDDSHSATQSNGDQTQTARGD